MSDNKPRKINYQPTKHTSDIINKVIIKKGKRNLTNALDEIIEQYEKDHYNELK